MRDEFRKWLYHRGRLQIFSVTVALLAWFIVHSGQTVQQRTEFHLEYVNLPAHLIFKKDPPSTLRVLLTGSFHRVRSMGEDAKVYLVDLSQSRAGLNSLDVDLSNLRLPMDVMASNPVPRRLDFQLDELQKKEVPLRVEFIGKPAEGYMITKFEAKPNPVQLVGPLSSLEVIQEVSVKVPVEGKTENFSTSILLNLGLPQTKTVESVFVEVEISRLNLEKEFPKVPVMVTGAEGSVKITPPTARVVLRGTEGKLAEAEKNLRVLVPATGLKRGRYRVRAELESREGVELVSLQPESFIVEVSP